MAESGATALIVAGDFNTNPSRTVYPYFAASPLQVQADAFQ